MSRVGNRGEGGSQRRDGRRGGREWEEQREDLIRVNLQCPVPNS